MQRHLPEEMVILDSDGRSARFGLVLYLVTDQLIQNSLGWGWFAAMLLLQISGMSRRSETGIWAVCVVLAVLLGGWTVLFGT